MIGSKAELQQEHDAAVVAPPSGDGNVVAVRVVSDSSVRLIELTLSRATSEALDAGVPHLDDAR